MNKKELLAMRPLRATAKMLEAEWDDIPYKAPGEYGTPWRKYSRFARCRVEDGILKVALFFPDYLRAGGRQPSYEVFLDRAEKKCITYDRMKDKWRAAKVDHLDWPYYVYATDSTWMSVGDQKTVQAYLGTEKGGYDGLLEYQEKLLDEALARRHKKVTDPWDADLSPTRGLPKDWDRWVDKVGIRENFIFYRYEKRGARQGYCTYCGKDVPIIGKPRYNKVSRCPCCRHEVTLKSIGKLGLFSTEWNCVYLLQPRPDGFVVREFWASRLYTSDNWKNPEIICSEKLRTIYDDQLNPRTYFWGDFKHRGYRWIKGMPNTSWYSPESYYYIHGNKPGRVYGKGLSRLLRTKLDGTGLKMFLNEDYFFMSPDEYLFALKEKCYKEWLSKADLPKLTEECLGSSRKLHNVFTGVKGGLTKALCLDTPRLGRLRRNDGGVSFLGWLQWEKEQGTLLNDEIIRSFCEWGIGPSDLTFIQDRMSPLQVHNYLRRQAKECKETAYQVFTTWKDYLSMAEKLKMDTNDAIVYRVKLLHQRHNELTERIYQENSKDLAADVLKKFPAVDDICQAIKEKYQYKHGKYAVVVPDGALDIIVEGKRLNHCVGGADRYWDRIQRHEAYILFLRKVPDLNMPYYTLEIEPDGTVRQLRTKFDRQEADIDDAREFLAMWQKEVTLRLTSEDRKAAADSRILREQEFEQMRRDNVIIHAGDLAGQRLVDVLTADLMENAA